jgi:hypothetical protein
MEYENMELEIWNHISKFSLQSEFHPHHNTIYPRTQFYCFNFTHCFYAIFKELLAKHNSCDFVDHLTLFDKNGNVIIDYADFGFNQFYINTKPENIVTPFLECYPGVAKLTNDVYGT